MACPGYPVGGDGIPHFAFAARHHRVPYPVAAVFRDYPGSDRGIGGRAVVDGNDGVAAVFRPLHAVGGFGQADMLGGEPVVGGVPHFVTGPLLQYAGSGEGGAVPFVRAARCQHRVHGSPPPDELFHGDLAGADGPAGLVHGIVDDRQDVIRAGINTGGVPYISVGGIVFRKGRRGNQRFFGFQLTGAA